MSDARFEMFRELLHTLRDDIIKETEKVDRGQINADSDDLADVVDRSSMEADRNFTLRLLDRDRKLLHKIDEALERIETGDFGLCDECGEDIGEERLKARPVATLCITCKEESEAEERKRA